MNYSHVKGQNAVFDNNGTYTATSYLHTYTGFPTPGGAGTALRLGFGYTPHTYRLNVYGGGIRNSWHIGAIGSPYMTWQEQMKYVLNSGLSVPNPITYDPGVRFLANRHNWAGYQGVFGLRERQSNFVLIDVENNQYGFVENAEPKDAVISFNYPNTALENKWSRLIFQKVELDTMGGTDATTELAVLDAHGNLGFRTNTPEARIEIFGDNGLPANQTNKAISIRHPNGNNPVSENFTITTNANGSLLGFGTDEPQAKIDIRGNGGLVSNNPILISAYDDLGEEKILVKNGYSVTNGPNTTKYSAKFWINHENGNNPGFDNYLGGTTRLQQPIIQALDNNNNLVDVSGSQISNGGTGINLRMLFGNEMRCEIDPGYIDIYDKNVSYFRGGSNEIYMETLKTNPGSISYLTIDNNGKLGNSASFPNPGTAWSYEGNYWTNSNVQPFFGTTVGSNNSYIGIVFNGENFGEIRSKHEHFGTQNSGLDFYSGDLRWKALTTIGGMSTLLGPVPAPRDYTTLTLIGTNKWSSNYQNTGQFDWIQQAKLIEGYSPIVNLNLEQVNVERTFTLYQTGQMEIGSLPSPANLGTYSNPTDYLAAVSIGKLRAEPTVKYSLAIFDPNDYDKVQFAIGYDNGSNKGKVFLGLNSILDPYNNTAIWDGDFKPFSTGNRNLGATTLRWNKVYATDLNLATGCYLNSSSNHMEWDGDVYPHQNQTWNLGSNSAGWANVYAYNYPSMSDERLKSEISDISTALDVVKKLRPVSYFWKNQELDADLHWGFIAQELKTVFPNSIVDSKNDTLSVRYMEIIPILTKAIQEQQKIIDSFKLNYENLMTLITTSNKVLIQEKEESNGKLNKIPILFQNQPNPFNNETFIDFFLPVGHFQANIAIYDLSGKLVYSYSIDKEGFGRVELKDYNISQGEYLYSLFVDGKVVDTKKMQVVKN